MSNSKQTSSVVSKNGGATTPSHQYHTRSKLKPTSAGPNYKIDVTSSSEDDEDGSDYEDISDSDEDRSEEDEDEDEDEEGSNNFLVDDNEQMDMKEYRNFLSTIFPSKYITKKASHSTPSQIQPRSVTPIMSENIRDSSPPPAPRKLKKNYAKIDSLVDSHHRSCKSQGLCDVSRREAASISREPASISRGSSKNLAKGKARPAAAYDSAKYNIIFTLGGNNIHRSAVFDEDEDYDEEEDDSDYDDEEDYDDSDYDEDSEDSDSDETISENDDMTMTAESSAVNSPTAIDVGEPTINSTACSNVAAFTKFKTMIDGLSDQERKNPIMKEMIADMHLKEKTYLKTLNKKTLKEKRKNTNKFRDMLKEKNVMNDLHFFQKKMTTEEQQTVLKQMEEVKQFSAIDKPYRLALLDADIPTQFKACAYKKISSLKYMEPGGGEYHKIKNWVDTFMQIPFGNYQSLPLTLQKDGVEKCHEFMLGAKKILDEAVYGLNDAKLQIMQMVGQWIVNPSAVGTAIAIKGPMGTGKTTLVKEGISKILGREFAFIALGGATDSSFLEGHSYTYEGSSWGKIVDILIQSKCMNPVIYFDELDKVSDTPKGEEIIGILTHLTDTTQNSKFHDKYFAELDFDLSRCLFIFSYNDESKISPILRDRMYRIQTKGYDQPQKITIATDYLLPKIRDQVCFQPDEICIPVETLQHIISNHTEKEDGVRNLKRCLEIVHTKLNLYRLMNPGTNLFESDMALKVEFPFQVTPEIVDKLIKKNNDGGAWTGMYS